MSIIESLLVKLGFRNYCEVQGYIGNTMGTDPCGVTYPHSPRFIVRDDKTIMAFIYKAPATATAVLDRKGRVLEYRCTDERLTKGGIDPERRLVREIGHVRTSAHAVYNTFISITETWDPKEAEDQSDIDIALVLKGDELVLELRRH